MSGSREVVRNTTFSVATLVAKIGASVGLLIALARVLPRDGFGVFTYAFSAATILGYIVDYGFNIKLLKDLTEHPRATRQTVSTAVGAKVLLTASVICLGVALWFWPSLSASERQCLVLLGLAQVLASIGTTLLNPFKCIDHFEVETLYVGLDSLITLIACLGAALFSPRPERIAAAFLGAKCVFCAFVWRRYAREYGFDRISLTTVLHELSDGLPYAVHLFVGNVYLNIDTVILKEFVPIGDVALYQAGMRLVIGAGMALSVVNSVLTPRLTWLRAADEVRFRREAKRTGLVLAVAGILVLVLFTLGGRQTVALVYGPKYRDLASLLVIFGFVVFLRYFSAVYGVLLTISGRQAIRAIGVAFTLAYMIALDLVVIPRFGTLGAAWVLLSAHVFLTLVYAYFVRSEYGHLFFHDTGRALPAVFRSTRS